MLLGESISPLFRLRTCRNSFRGCELELPERRDELEPPTYLDRALLVLGELGYPLLLRRRRRLLRGLLTVEHFCTSMSMSRSILRRPEAR